MSDLMFLHDDNGAFVDYSADAKDYLRDNFVVDFVQAEDNIYIGLYKPFNAFYVEMETSLSGVSISYTYNGNNLDVEDDTKSFLRSGFVQFDKPSDWVAETVNGVEAYWLRLNTDIDASIDLKGVNIVFADDNDLRSESRTIDKMLAKNDNSFIAYHVAARNEIIQTLRNGGNNKRVDDLLKNITKWDILDLGEIRQAAKYLALAKIFFDNSDNVDDKAYSKFRDYEGMFGAAFKLFYLKLDQNDDGEYDQIDDLVDGSIEVLRV